MAAAVLGFRRHDLNASLQQRAFSQYTNLYRRFCNSPAAVERTHSDRETEFFCRGPICLTREFCVDPSTPVL